MAYSFSSTCESGQRLFYNITSNTEPYTVEVTKETDNYNPSYNTYPTGDLTIPSSVTHSGRTYSVTSIGDMAFSYCSGLTSVSIPNSITTIGYSAFWNCSGLPSVTIPSSVTSIGTSAFYGCNELTAVNYTGSIAQWCGIDFSNLDANPLKFAGNLYIDNELVTDLVIPETITEIKPYTFCGATCLETIIIPNTVTDIGMGAVGVFWGCSGIVEMTIPFVGNNASATSASASTLFGNIFDGGTYSGSTMIRQHFSGGSNYKTYYIPSSLRSVTVTGGVLLYGAFDYCTMLTSIKMPNSITNIGERCFYNCTGLTSITIPSSVTSIGDLAFSYCSGLTNIYANPTTPPTATTYAFSDINFTPIASLWVPCGSIDAYLAANGWSQFGNVNERRAYMLNVSSENLQQGTAIITQQPDCSDGIAIITATPNDGYGFTGWNDGNTDNPRTIVVTTDTMFVATFTSLSNIETNINSEISIFPNPTNDKLNISSSETISEIEIVNAMGQVVKRMEINSDNAVCNVEDLTSGVYVVRFRAINSSKEATISQQKFIKE